MSAATLYTDGGARGNPGPAGIGYALTLPNKPAITYGVFIGRATNNQAEYTALQQGLERALAEGATELECYLDSQLVVEQLNGNYRVKEATLLQQWQKIQALRAQFKQISFNHVRREQNKLADKLVNEAIDKALGEGV